IITPAPKARPIVKPVTRVNELFSFIPRKRAKGANLLEITFNQPKSLKYCITIINGITINDSCKTANKAVCIPCKIMLDQDVRVTSEFDISSDRVLSEPEDHSKLIKIAANIASAILNPEINHQLTPTRDANADSKNNLCEKDSNIAIINTSLTVKSKD